MRLQDPQTYLNLPWSIEDREDGNYNQFFQRSSKETIFINTLLCSTKLTQNGMSFFLLSLCFIWLCQIDKPHFTVDLLSLLKWKSFPNRIQDTLNKIMKLNGEEIVKVDVRTASVLYHFSTFVVTDKIC